MDRTRVAVRYCLFCDQTKPIDEFLQGRRYKQWLRLICIDCDPESLAEVIGYVDGGYKWRRPRTPSRKRYSEDTHRRGADRRYKLLHAPGGPYSPARDDYKERRRLYRGKCAYCRERKATTFDHAIPVSRGGSNWPANIYPACYQCNANKGDRKLHTEWVPTWKRRA